MKRINLWIAHFKELVSVAGFGQTFLYILYRLSGPRTMRLRLKGFPKPLALRVRDSDFKVFRSVFCENEFDLGDLMPPIDGAPIRFIIDGGANVGYSSVYFARQYPEARVIAIEPVLENYRLLLENTEAYRNIEPLRCGLWSSATNLVLSNPEVPSWAFRMSETAAANVPETESCPGITVPEILSKYGVEQIDLLKLDIEGAEEQLFKAGVDDWLGRVRLLIIEVHSPTCDELVRNACARYDFKQTTKGEKLVFYKD